MPADALQPPPLPARGEPSASDHTPPSDAALRMIAWLASRLGDRYQGWCVEASGMVAVDILKLGSERECDRYLGATLDEALKKAIDAVRVTAAEVVASQLERPAPRRLATMARRGEPVPTALARAAEAMERRAR